MKKLGFSQNLKKLPPYLFAEIDRLKGELRQKNISFIDLSIGDPDIPAPAKVIDVLYKAACDKSNQKYALDQGKLVFRQSIQRWFSKRFGVSLDVDKEILPLIGSKEGLVHFPLAFVNRGDYVLIPSPGYPGYRGATIFAQGKPYEMPLLAKNNFIPDLKKIPVSVRNKSKIIYLNYPNNPTTALAPREFLQEAVIFCVKYGIILAYDNAYSEVYFEEKPVSIFEIKGAKDIAIEFHSLSKTFCMTGFRVGFACGNETLIKGLLRVKTNFDSGVFGAIQEASAYGLDNEDTYVQNLRKIIEERKNVFVNGLKQKGFEEIFAESTFYVWVKIPSNFKGSMEFAKSLISKGIVATPGVGFGKYGEGYIRFALTVDKDIIKKAVNLL